MKIATAELEAALDRLLLADANALDSKDMPGWLANYAEEDGASYYLSLIHI